MSQAEKITKRDRANLQRYADAIAAEIEDMQTAEGRRYRPDDFQRWEAERRAQLDAIAEALEAGRVSSTPCTAWDALEARAAYRAAEKAAQDGRQGFHIPNDLYIAERDALDAYRAIASVALHQARALALEALAADVDAWTRKPSHYKATAAAVREITDRALVATGCRARLTCDYSDWTYPSLEVSVDPVMWQYSTPRAVDARLTQEAGYLTPEALEHFTPGEWIDWRPAQVRRRVRAYRDDVARGRDMATAYEARARAVRRKYEILELGDDLERAMRPSV